MTQEERIARINALAAKAKAGTLTPEETMAAAAGSEYLADFRPVSGPVDNTWVVGPDGSNGD